MRADRFAKAKLAAKATLYHFTLYLGALHPGCDGWIAIVRTFINATSVPNGEVAAEVG